MKKICFALMGACIVLGSCSTGEAAASAAAQLLGGSSQALLFLDCKAVSENEIEFEFAQPVKVISLSFDPVLAIALIEDGSTVRVTIEEVPKPGIRFMADLLAEDADKNTINVLVPFTSRNNRMPKLAINELRTVYSKPRSEFIEFKMLTAGNLGAIRVFIAGNYKAPLVYEFSPVEVKEGEYVTLHLRTLDADSRDEYGDDLAESGGTDSSATARDFWIPDSAKLLHNTDAVYVLDQDDKALDAVMISENPDQWWTKEYFAEAADFLFKQGAWKSPDGKICRPADAVNTYNSRTAATRSISRDETMENTHSAADWYITANSGATPGKPNDPKRFSN
ncbi:MAG: hypothetical protein LBG91_01500 [Treponema sp.]|jgi:hypothetical protein|nr:hypothetical protein [Treponema sp.]